MTTKVKVFLVHPNRGSSFVTESEGVILGRGVNSDCVASEDNLLNCIVYFFKQVDPAINTSY